MRLPEIQLDDRRFGDLVNEARLRVSTVWPEWSDHNIADPGITLIELFAWMTEMTIYRLNRVPDKLHMALLELLGMRLNGPSTAVADLRFRVVSDAGEPVRIPAATQVATTPLDREEAIVFQVGEERTIPVLRHRVLATEYGGSMRAIEHVGEGVPLRPAIDGNPLVFASVPAVGDAFYLGFDVPLDRLTVAVSLELEPARGPGLEPSDPPLRWEASKSDGEWLEAEVIADTTGGFLRGSGTVELQLPPQTGAQAVLGERLHWLRCRVAEHGRRQSFGAAYEYPPTIRSAATAAIGAQLPATHAGRHEDEQLGISDGTPGQVFSLRHHPVVRPAAGEVLEVEDVESGTWTAWEPRDSFASSTYGDTHYLLDPVSGTVELGPAIREQNGGWTLYGAVPPKGAALRFSSYRSGGGRRGNVAAGTLTNLLDPLEGVASVTNPRPAVGGVDAESVEAVRQRAALEVRTRYRAVTADDFEFLAAEATPRVARAVCGPSADSGAVVVRVIPLVFDPDRYLGYEELLPGDELLAEVGAYLDERRLIGTTVHLLPGRFRGLTAVVDIQVDPWSDPTRVELDVAHALYRYLNPLVGGPAADGWPAGRAVNHGELYGVVHAVTGVEFVQLLHTYESDPVTGEQAAQATASQIVLDWDELIASGHHVVRARREQLKG
jgi:predicted phage baseplate assembly protein